MLPVAGRSAQAVNRVSKRSEWFMAGAWRPYWAKEYADKLKALQEETTWPGVTSAGHTGADDEDSGEKPVMRA